MQLLRCLDGTRVVHTTGWRVGEERELLCAFNDYRYRANSRDGTPAALKENSHMYECRYSDPRQAGPSFTSAALDAYPLYSFDLFNCHAAKGCALLEGVPFTLQTDWLTDCRLA